jgi:hypothetical protein
VRHHPRDPRKLEIATGPGSTRDARGYQTGRAVLFLIAILAVALWGPGLIVVNDFPPHPRTGR